MRTVRVRSAIMLYCPNQSNNHTRLINRDSEKVSDDRVGRCVISWDPAYCVEQARASGSQCLFIQRFRLALDFESILRALDDNGILIHYPSAIALIVERDRDGWMIRIESFSPRHQCPFEVF